MKRYLEEPGSDAFDAFCALPGVERVICALGVTEFTGVLQRRIRMQTLTAKQASAVRMRFLGEVAAGGWRVADFENGCFANAAALMSELGAPLATLDALHLACAMQQGATEIATADPQLAFAARKAKMRVHAF